MNGQALGRLLLEATVLETVSGVPYDAKIYARGAAVPSDASTGYAKGCLFVQEDATNQSNLLYANIGTAASCNFNLVTIAAD
jgi:hypothetical protein